MNSNKRVNVSIVQNKQSLESGNRSVYALWIVYVVTGIFVALGLPEGVGSPSTSLGLFADQVAKVIPSIGRLSAVSEFPETTKVYCAVMWSLQPFVLAYTAIRWRITPPIQSLGRVLAVGVLSLPVLMLFIYVSLTLPGELVTKIDGTFSRGHGAALFTLISSSRLMLGMLGGIYFVVLIYVQWGILLGYPRAIIQSIVGRKH